MLKPVIMAGGSGTRLWPLSRELFPKQFLALNGQHSMLQETMLRLQHLECESPILICNEQHRFIVAEQMRQIGIEHPTIILEPEGRNTAPAVTLAALWMESSEQDPVFLVLPADHLIGNEDVFEQAVLKAKALAMNGKLVTFGINPTKPETGYGYIQRGPELSENAFVVKQFVEKPSLKMAKEYISSNEYYWNSGIFVFKAGVYLSEMKKHDFDIYSACQKALSKQVCDMDFIRIDKVEFNACPSDSIDYAVMENTSEAAVVRLDSSWSDVGSWSSLWEVRDKDPHGNSARGDVILQDTSNCLIESGNKLVATVGVEDLVIVDTPDALLVAKKDKVQTVKTIVAKLKKENRSEASNHREVYRPWGVYDSIDVGHRYQVKRITVKPGAKLSVQMHHHRAEHWIVVKGTARVTNGEKSYLLSENQSTYIPIGQVHALENPGKIPLELIEVQSGAYLGEDDIIRFKDEYGRDAHEDIKFDYRSILQTKATETS